MEGALLPPISRRRRSGEVGKAKNKGKGENQKGSVNQKHSETRNASVNQIVSACAT
ncbi:MAG: hypothetical protein OXFUSZZB_002107 [Candidatus Fervidibacter sp.]|jgi:hypothetical protein